MANWHITGYVDWKESARAWVRDQLSENEPRQIARLMFEYVEAGGEIDQVAERRPEWNDRPFHYDLRISVGAGCCTSRRSFWTTIRTIRSFVW